MNNSILVQMSEDLLIPVNQLQLLSITAPHRYKVYQIKKRNGRGERTIAQPAKVVKRLQYWVIEHILKQCPIHNCATAYQEGSSIRKNASAHKDCSFILKMDFQNFFPSLTPNDFIAHLKLHGIPNDYTEEDINLLCRILFWKPRRGNGLILSIGAPSSPAVSNTLLFSFDEKMSTFCDQNHICYTRYADDLTFSMNNRDLRTPLLDYLCNVLHELPFPRLYINREKTFFGSKSACRKVTGLVLTNDGRVSLGREKKRLIRSMIDHYLKGHLNGDEAKQLRGLLAFAKDVEPSFVERMNEHYGAISF